MYLKFPVLKECYMIFITGYKSDMHYPIVMFNQQDFFCMYLSLFFVHIMFKIFIGNSNAFVTFIGNF